jgi:hypothetical protein
MKRDLSIGVALLALTLAVASCGSDSGTGPGPGPVPEDQLHFLHVAAGAPSLVGRSVSFWASYDQDRDVKLYYAPLLPGGDSVEFLEFKVPNRSIARAPDGTVYGPGDSVLITISIADPVRMIAQFEPSGLQFSPLRPARLRFEFGEADADINGDGLVNATDSTDKQQLRLWRQENTGDPWTPVSSTVDVSLDECAADLLGFTHYAVAF